MTDRIDSIMSTYNLQVLSFIHRTDVQPGERGVME